MRFGGGQGAGWAGTGSGSVQRGQPGDDGGMWGFWHCLEGLYYGLGAPVSCLGQASLRRWEGPGTAGLGAMQGSVKGLVFHSVGRSQVVTGEITTCLGDKMPLGAETHKEQPWQPGALAGTLQALGKRILGHWASK